MLARDFGTLCAPTGSGKTVIALAMIAQRRQPTLIVVHTKDLAYQWVARVQQFLGMPAGRIGVIGAGQKKLGAQITVALVQSLYKCAAQIAPAVGHLVVDECHRTPSRTFTEAVTEFDAKFMLGLSATPYRRDMLSQLIFWHLGDLHHQVPKDDLVSSGQILQAQVILRPTTFKPYHDPVSEYSQMLSELTADDDRNRLICSDISQEATQARGVCLVLSDRKKHCQTLQLILKYKFGMDSTLLTGDLTLEERKDVLQRLNQGRIKVLIATGQLIGEGFDCENLATLFLVTPIRFSGRVIQYIGRILRPSGAKDQARIFDYVDDRVEVLKTAARARQRIYG
jgi:superfamily II DNA or RNA helicase